MVSASDNTANAVGVITGDNNNQQVTTNEKNYNNDQSQDAISTVKGDGNIVTTTNAITNNQETVSSSTSSTSITSVYNVYSNTVSHYTLDTGSLTLSQVVSIYSGEALVVDNNGGSNTAQSQGNVYRYTVKSSIPVLAYVINANDDGAVTMKQNAPEYDSAYQYYDHKNIDVTYSPKHMSTFQQFYVTLPKDGRYALVIDSRVTNHLDGVQSDITASTIDLYYKIEKLSLAASPNSSVNNSAIANATCHV
jgi:hypothetical protein